MYLYRAVDSEGKPLIFILAKIGIPNQPSAFQKPWLLRMCPPRVTKVAKNPVYPIAIQELKEEKACLLARK